MNWEDVEECNFCGSTKRHLIAWRPDNWYGRDLKVYECDECGLAFADPRPTFESMVEWLRPQFKALYERKLNRPRVREIHRSIVLRAMRYAKHPKTLFDVGTGAGTLLLEAKQLGLDVAGNDINEYACEQLRQQGITVYNVPTQELDVKDELGPFDIITCLDYLEHTYTPYDDLMWITFHQEYGGILYLKTLFLGCPDHQKEGSNWKLFGQTHNYYYWPDVLLRMIADVGYEVLWLHTTNATIHVIGRKVT